MNNTETRACIESAWEQFPDTKTQLHDLKQAVHAALNGLDSGSLRVAEKQPGGEWHTNQWLKKAVLLSFRLNPMRLFPGAPDDGAWWDKVPMKFAKRNQQHFEHDQFRAVPGSIVRRGAYIAPDVVLMPSFVNIGAFVDTRTMVDTWATIGSCAQIGKNVHVSGGAGIAGVLEPLQANPVIIEDNCFIGARAEIAEGVIVEENSVIAMGSYIGASTRIVNRDTKEIHYGRVPAGSVVVPGAMPSASKPEGPALYCVVIVKQVDAKTRAKTSINELLRDETLACMNTMSAEAQALELAKALIACPSVTPDAKEALDLTQSTLEKLGARCQRLPFSEPGTPTVDNLYARIGAKADEIGNARTLLFCGHVDVVPTGELGDWDSPPFLPTERNGKLFGRGAADMKTGVACFIAASAHYLDALKQSGQELNGALCFLITGDEEGPAINGSRKAIDHLAQQGERWSACLTGEPSCTTRSGEFIKIGRRGSLNAELIVDGKQGHVAYPHNAENALHVLSTLIDALTSDELDNGNARFEPSTLQVTAVTTSSTATNVVPGRARAQLNVRFGDLYTQDSLLEKLRQRLGAAAANATTTTTSGATWRLEPTGIANPFYAEPGALVDSIQSACRKWLGRTATLSTSGGTSDSRFIVRHCPTADFGIVGPSMHQVNEHVALDDIAMLTRLYGSTLEKFFNSGDDGGSDDGGSDDDSTR